MKIQVAFTGRDWTAHQGMGEVEVSHYYERTKDMAGNRIYKFLGQEISGWKGPGPDGEGGNLPGRTYSDREGTIPPHEEIDVKLIYRESNDVIPVSSWIFEHDGVSIYSQENAREKLNEMAIDIGIELSDSYDKMIKYLDGLVALSEPVEKSE